MFGKIAGFELRYQLKNPVFWVAAGLFFLLTFGSVTVDQIQIGSAGSVHKNGPAAIALTHLVLSVFFIFVSTAFVANVVVRDDETGFGPILRATRVSKAQYLFGRFTGAYLAAALAFLSVPLAMALGAVMPWIDPEKLGPFRPDAFAYAYLGLALPTVFATSALFFALATATRSMMATYVGVVAVLILYFVSQGVLGLLQLRAIQPYADPFGIGAWSAATRYFSTTDRNTLIPPLWGPVLFNRLEWIGLGLAFLAGAYALFRVEARGARRRKREALDQAAPAPAEAPAGRLGAPAAQSFGAAAQLEQLQRRMRFEMALAFRSPAFFILLALGLLNGVGRLWFVEGAYGSAIHPVTRLMIQGLRESFSVLPVIVAVYYAGELVWRDRDRRIDEIVDSTPAPDWSFAAPKMLAVAGVLGAMYLVSVAAAILVQLLKGYATPNLGEYLGWYLIPETIDAAQIAILAVFIQALSPNKFAGWLFMLVYLVAMTVLSTLGFEHSLYQYPGGPSVPLSDMNGTGVGGGARWWFRLYDSALALVLATLAYGLWRRGPQTSLRPRLARLPRRLSGVAGGLLAACLVAAVGLGGWIYVNTNVWNPYRTHLDDERYQADYEKTLLRYETLPQPKITDVTLAVDLSPHQRQAVTRGVYTLQNKTDAPIRELHVRFTRDLKVTSLSVEGGRPLKTFERFSYRIFAFDTPMQPGETRHLSFETRYGQHGFKNAGDTTRVVDNGTFLDNFEIAPLIGMDRSMLLRDRAKRRKYHLPPDVRPAKLEDVSAQRFNMIRKDSDWVNADITVSTVADQTPIAPGYKVSDVVADGRRTARFRTEAPIMDFFSIQSARYAEKHVPYKGIDLAVYYTPAHAWNVDRMIAALKAGLDYDQANFSPYQFRQARILEFPDYAQFAQSFANTIPYSEGIGFLFKPPADPVKAGKIDMVTYVTAHELGHQWWAHQVIGSNQQGSTVLDETLAQYSALMTMEHLYGRLAMPMFLERERDAYLRARGSESVEELPLERVEDQGYIHYNKGSLVMYRLKEVLGEAAVNRALRKLIADHAFRPAPYPRSLDLVAALRAEAGADPAKQQLITDLFEKITLYDVKPTRAVARRLPDNRTELTITVQARKLYADGQGREHAVAFRETLPFAVLQSGADMVRAAKGAAKAPWSVNQRQDLDLPVKDGVNTFKVTVPELVKGKLTFDPMNEIVDKTPSDNAIPITGG